jgi:hypothetical protein
VIRTTSGFQSVNALIGPPNHYVNCSAKTLAFVCCCHCRFLPTELVEDSHWLPIFNHVTAMRFLGYPCKLRPAQLDAAEGAIHPINYRRLREGLRAVADVAALPLLRWHGSRFQSEIECYR